MAVQWNVEGTRTSEYRFFPEDIKIKPELNGRIEKPDIEWLIQDIARNGQIQPVTIRNDGGTPVLVAGFSRWRAISEINKRHLAPVKLQMRCTYVQCSEAEGFVANIAENRFRNNTTMLDDAHNIARLIHKYAMTEEQVAVIYFPTASDDGQKKEALKFIRKRLGLATLTPEAEVAVKDGRLKESAAVAIAKLDEEHQREVLTKSKGKKVKGKDIAAAKPKKAATEKAGKPTFTSLKQAIETVIETGKFKGLGGKPCEASDDMVEWLSNLLGGEK